MRFERFALACETTLFRGARFRGAEDTCPADAITVQPAMAWSECGNHVIAVLAFDLMEPDKQYRILEILKHHPRFAEDFKSPGSPKLAGEVADWQIERAGYLPDVACHQPDFNHPNWHCQLGSSLTIGQNVKIPETAKPLSTSNYRRLG